MPRLTLMDMAIGQGLDRLFRNNLQPVDLAKAVQRAVLKNERRTLSRAYGPNLFKVKLPQADYQRLEPVLPEIERDILAWLTQFMEGQGLEPFGVLGLAFSPGSDLRSPKVEASFHGEELCLRESENTRVSN